MLLSPRVPKHRRSTSKAVEKQLLATDGLVGDDFTNWNFNVFELSTPPSQLAFVQRLSVFFELHEVFGLSLEAIGAFYADVQQGYVERTTQPVVSRRYHTFLHAVDVMQTVAVFLRGFHGHAYLSPRTASALLIASLCHDIGHVGLTNQFLVNSGHPLTLTYRNPVLESMHTARTMALVKQHGFLATLETQESLRIAKTIARCIMYTDVSIHSELLRKMRALPRGSSTLLEEDAYVYCGFLLHTADICNPAKEWTLAEHWTDLIMSEFFEQGALEKREGLVVSTFRNADQINTSEIQANFVRLMLQPTLSLLAEFLPAASFLQDIAEANRRQWEAESRRALTAPQIELIRALSRPLEHKHLSRRERIMERLTRFSEHNAVVVSLFLASLYATFSDNMRIASTSVRGDLAYGVCTVLVLVVMLLDVVLTSIVLPSYRWSFYFWLDLASSVTLLTEVPFINFHSQVSHLSLSGGAKIAKVAGFRLARMLRMVRMATLFKMFKQIMVKRSYRPRRLSLVKQNRASTASVSPPLPSDGPRATFSPEDLKRIFALPDGRPMVYTMEHIELLLRGAYRGYPPPDDARHNFCARVASSTNTAPMRTFALSAAKFHKMLLAMEEAYEEDMTSNNKISQLTFYASRLGEKVADSTIRHVIFLLLAVLIILTECYTPRDVSPITYGLTKLHMWADGPLNTLFNRELAAYINATEPVYLYIARANASAVHTAMQTYAHVPWPIDAVTFNGSAIYASTVLTSYRVEYLNVVAVPSNCTWPSPEIPCQSIAVFDGGPAAKSEAIWEIVRTLFIISCFASGGMLLTLDVYKRVILPVERMVSLTQQLALNPTKSVSAVDEEKPMYEMKLLQNTLTKVARLLQIGYGSAGSAIISKNMMGAEFNPIIAGKKVHAVFGFCDIRRFTDITECLQEQVMMFTNTIGHIVHHAAYTFDGHANKNVGDAFLLVWKIPEDSPDVAVINQARPPAHLTTTSGAELDFLFFDEEGSKKMAQSKVYVATAADNALMAFLKTMVDIDISPKLKAYTTNKLLQTRFESPFQVKMGYGLHVGWAIDGAIGSKYKIDASYLSSDVNMASTLESTTKLYHIPLIMSHSFYNLLSPQLQQFCRCIDCVLFDGCAKPMALYTCDYVNQNVRHVRGVADVPLLQMGLLNGFTSTFEKGVNEYLRGAWREAHDTLDFLLAHLKPHDGPAEALMEYMGKYAFVAPPDWPGYRKL
ncbi:hypothetical protein SDRG_14374 [Saprolegnia diclina VS20]|uniref:Phosphodiesterase n=1 Tax=Saprolegnia diclina (strain VS20) TaxID=1156394 RepID=T0Q308_SAPDV|nr:hypothetical protein SDRG_14374 [Saprolegnia diclina VS20]EQC27790.1 hypothetical protein SDRG_14374 [Saprolegnia diclina VS20]|eukprot:XP_008618720.1 hypothetical protein SDRG_14374 [Saprolegnia diclina VS20]